MGVYQSATLPEIRRKSFRQIEDAHLVDRFGQRAIIQRHRKTGGIPRKVNPSVVRLTDPSAYRFEYDWYEVETFN